MNAVDTRERTEVTPTRRSLAKLWAAGTSAAVLMVASAYFLADAVSGPLVVASTGEIDLANVIGFTIMGGTIGAALAYVVARFARRPRLTFLTASLIALAGYAVVPFTAAESLASAIWLNVFHLVVAIPVIAALTFYLPRNRTPVGA